jgi:tRNA nucleotidyltransferase (CCA-adding enzyme)
VACNLSDLLKKNISPTQLELIQRVAGEASLLGLPIYIVGGFVRDLLLGHPGLDFDLVVEGDALKLADSLASKYGGQVTAHTKFGTAKWNIRKSEIENQKSEIRNRGSSIEYRVSETESRISNPEFLDLISARSETYKHPAALPTVRMGSLADDLRRRDFTINTLAIRLDGAHFGELDDELGGVDDLNKGLVRILHPRSFVDDPTRLFRLVRYEARYQFKIAKDTLALIPEAREYISALSPQRVRHELDLILDEPNAALMLSRLDKLGLLEAIHPALHFDRSMRRRFESAKNTSNPELSNYRISSIESLNSRVSNIESSNIEYRDLRWLLWLMTLSGREITSLNKRLHFTASLLKSFIASSKLWAGLPAFAHLKPSQCVERLDHLPLLSIVAVSLAAPRGKSKQALENYVLKWRHVKPKTTGHDLKNLSLEPGPQYQIILRKLRNAWLDEKIRDDREEQAFLMHLLDR